MNKKNLYLLTLLFAFMALGLVGCSDDDDAAQPQYDLYGYVQFKLYKKASAEGGAIGTRAVERLDKLSDAYKIKVIMQSAGQTLSHTLLFNSFDDESAEYGLRSEKLKILAGTYNIIGYVLYDELDKELLASDVNGVSFTVVGGGMAVCNLSAEVAPRGKASFRIVKNIMGTTRAEEDESFHLSNILCADITIQNTFTLEKITIEEVAVKYEEGFNNDATPGNNSETSYAECDTVVWLPAGTYKVHSFRAYSDKKGKVLLGEVYNTTQETFEIADNELNENVRVPFDIKGTEEYIKDYIALKEIWEAMDGPNWKYAGIAQAPGCNWNFNKDIDMWGVQPGVQLFANGRVATISLEGFGAKGVVPSSIGQLTELVILYLGSHSEELGGHIFPEMTAEQKNAIRYDYEEKYLKKDFRTALSEEWQKTIELDKNEKPLKSVQLKHIMFGDLTNQITGISKAIMRCTKLEQLYIANSPITHENFFVDDIDANHKYADEESSWSWENFTDLTDMEIYNCPQLTALPMDMLSNIPELQMINIACLKSISGEQLLADWKALINGKSGAKVQGIYMGYNNLKEFPEYDDLNKMRKLGLLDLTNNRIEKLNPFGKEVNLAKVYLDYNKIKEIPNKDGYFCGFEQMESFTASNNEMTVFPDIFNARYINVFQSIDFSGNKISEFENGDNFRGVNATQLNLSKNRLETFPAILIKKNSPLNYLVLSGNGMTEIPKGSFDGDNAFMLEALDLSFNKLSELPVDFSAQKMPYLTAVDLSYNRFKEFPTEPLSVSGLSRFFIRYQSDEDGNRCLRDWPEGIWQHLGLRYLLMGGNDLRKIEDETMSMCSLFYFEIADNPNITINVAPICDYIYSMMYYYGMPMLVYDKTQDIRGCDILDLEK